MKRVSMSIALALALCCALARNALAQDDLDPTMRVLDDVKDVDTVIRQIAAGKAAADGARGQRARAADPKAEPIAHEDIDEGAADHGDGKYEDNEVPADELGQ